MPGGVACRCCCASACCMRGVGSAGWRLRGPPLALGASRRRQQERSGGGRQQARHGARPPRHLAVHPLARSLLHFERSFGVLLLLPLVRALGEGATRPPLRRMTPTSDNPGRTAAQQGRTTCQLGNTDYHKSGLTGHEGPLNRRFIAMPRSAPDAQLTDCMSGHRSAHLCAVFRPLFSPGCSPGWDAGRVRVRLESRGPRFLRYNSRPTIAWT